MVGKRGGGNILVFLTDDHAQWASPVYGNGAIDAVALERLAARGTVFDNAFTATPVCSPARASFFTGLMPSQHGVHDFLQSARQFDDRSWLENSTTLPERLAAAGYQCGFVGKWHVGRDSDPQPGFEQWFALSGEYPIHHDGDNGFSRNGEIGRRDGNLTEILTEEALAFLKGRDRNRPFFLFVGLYATHSPWQDQPERLVERYRKHDFAEIPTGERAPGAVNLELDRHDPVVEHEARAQYYAAVSHIDESVSAILAELEAQRALEETLVAYTADHGMCLGQHGVWGKGNGTRPQNMLEPSIRIPMLIAGPGTKAGARRSEFFDHADLFATLTDFAGLPADTEGSPGRSGLPLLAGDAVAWRGLQFGEYGDLRMARSATHKLLAFRDGRRSLHVVAPGADEVTNIAADPGAAPIIEELGLALAAFFAAHSRPPASGQEALAPLTFNRNQAWQPFVAMRDV